MREPVGPVLMGTKTTPQQSRRRGTALSHFNKQPSQPATAAHASSSRLPISHATTTAAVATTSAVAAAATTTALPTRRSMHAATSTSISTPPIPQSAAPSSSSPRPRLVRRKADTLNETTAVQRLVEYFVVVSSHPRWNDPVYAQQLAATTSAAIAVETIKSPQQQKQQTRQQQSSNSAHASTKPSSSLATSRKQAPARSENGGGGTAAAGPQSRNKLRRWVSRSNHHVAAAAAPQEHQRQRETRQESSSSKDSTTSSSAEEDDSNHLDTASETQAISGLDPTSSTGHQQGSAAFQDEADIGPCTSSRNKSFSNGNEATGNIHMPKSTGYEYTFQPVVTARYPLQDHHDNPLNKMILQFCYPSGDVIFPSRRYDLPRVHHFVLTNERGRKVYGTCLTLWEDYIPTASGPWGSQAVTHEDEQRIGEESGIEVSVDSHGKILYIPKVLCILSTWPYLTAFREYLAQLYRLASATNVMTAPIERYIVNLCQEIPAPPPGAYEIQLSILDSTIRFWAPPAKLPIAYVALPFKTMFECLDIDNILAVWSSMVMERKIILLSSQYSILTVCSEIFCSLLFPMRWSHLYAPLLPRMLCPILDAPVPYLCGIVRENWLYAENFVGGDIVVVDLDRNTVKIGPLIDTASPSPPAKRWNKLHTALVDAVGPLYWRARGLEADYHTLTTRKLYKKAVEQLKRLPTNDTQWIEKLASLDHAYNLAYTPDSPNLLSHSLPENELSQWNRVQEAFLRFFVALLKDYQSFIAWPQSPPGTASSRPSFDREGFIAKSKMENVSYLSALTMTQQFDDFLTKRMFSPGEPDLVFFDQSIKAKLNRSRLKIKKVDTGFLEAAKIHKELVKVSAVPPNRDGLPDHDNSNNRQLSPYVYKVWPERFDHDLFCEPRPIPKMISAEFDRQSLLVSKLRAHLVMGRANQQHLPGGNEDLVEDGGDGGSGSGLDDMLDDVGLDFYGGDYDPFPEVASFTVFFFVYSALVGRDWQEYTQQQRLRQEKAQEQRHQRTSGSADGASSSSLPNQHRPQPGSKHSSQRNTKTEDREDFADRIELLLSPEDRTGINQCFADLSMDTCNTCPDEGLLALNTAMVFIEKGASNIIASLFDNPGDCGDKVDIPMQQDSDESLEVVKSSKEWTEEYEEAVAVAAAQLDLAFETLTTMRLRGLSGDSDAYLSLMEACGRCGDTQRALKLIELMKNDGFVADSEVLASFVCAFAHDNGGSTDIGAPAPNTPERESCDGKGSDAYFSLLKNRFEDAKRKRKDSKVYFPLKPKSGCSSSTDRHSPSTSRDESSLNSDWSTKSPSTGGAAFLDWFAHHNYRSPNESKRGRRRKRRKSSLVATPRAMPVTEMLTSQLDLGEGILDFVYPDLSIDTNSDTCPQCSKTLTEDDVVDGWTPCAFQDYTSQCPQCQHRFVPRFTVTSSATDFDGSQGYQTPLYCEFLSPWVIRKQLQTTIKGETGIVGMLHPDWRKGTGIQATLFWNLMVLFRRYRLPFTFLLQGNFQNRLILPRRPDEM